MSDPEPEPQSTAPLPPATATGEHLAAENESTVGTGSVFAIGCSIATVLVILVGIGVLLLRAP